jgi:hypothetical protein
MVVGDQLDSCAALQAFVGMLVGTGERLARCPRIEQL